MALEQSKYTPEIQFVSLGGETEAAGYFWEAVVGNVVAHMVHYGESSFGTVFTTQAPRQEYENILFPKYDYKLSLVAKSYMEDAVWEACYKSGRDTERSVHYLQEMDADTALMLARAEQDRLRATVDRQQRLSNPA